jgi:hypothetical protein
MARCPNCLNRLSVRSMRSSQRRHKACFVSPRFDVVIPDRVEAFRMRPQARRGTVMAGGEKGRPEVCLRRLPCAGCGSAELDRPSLVGGAVPATRRRIGQIIDLVETIVPRDSLFNSRLDNARSLAILERLPD